MVKKKAVMAMTEIKESNSSVLRHAEICDALNELYSKKNHDYGDSFHRSFEKYGLDAACIRLNDKMNRLEFLSRISKDDIQVFDENIRDTLMDLANYAIMTIMELDKENE